MWNAISWSSDGKQLAFNAVIDGDSGDLYTFGVEDGSLNRLTSGPTEAVFPSWSPDGRAIVHGSVERLNVESSGSGYDYKGVWSARVDGGSVELLFTSDVIGFENVLGWLDLSTALVDTATPNENPFCGYRDLRTIDIRNGERISLLNGQYTDRAFDPINQTVLFSTSEDPNCEQELGTGIYLLDIGSGASIKVVEGSSSEIEWSPAASLYFAETRGNSVIAVSSAGELIDLFLPEGAIGRLPIVSATADGLAWRGKEGLWIGSLRNFVGDEPVQVLSERVHEASWSPDGNHLLILTFDKLFVASTPEFIPILVANINGRSPTWLAGP